MIIKTSELEGVGLDWAVEKALGGVRKGHRVDFPSGYWCVGLYRPSTGWDQGGPLISRRLVKLTPLQKDVGKLAYWRAAIMVPMDTIIADGPTALIAAMRAIVAAELGETVDVPEELLK